MSGYKQFIGTRQRRSRALRMARLAIVLLLVLVQMMISSWTSPRRPAEPEPDGLSATELQILICDARWSGYISEVYAEKYPEYAPLFREAYRLKEVRNPLYGEPWELTMDNIQWMVETAIGYPALAGKYAERYPAGEELFLAAGAASIGQTIWSLADARQDNGF